MWITYRATVHRPREYKDGNETLRRGVPYLFLSLHTEDTPLPLDNILLMLLIWASVSLYPGPTDMEMNQRLSDSHEREPSCQDQSRLVIGPIRGYN